MIKYQCKVAKSIEVDDFEKGCLLKGGQDFGILDTLTANELLPLINLVTASYGGDISIEDDCPPCIQRLEAEDGLEANERELASWKLGKTVLYAATYTLYFSRIESAVINNEDLRFELNKGGK